MENTFQPILQDPFYLLEPLILTLLAVVLCFMKMAIFVPSIAILLLFLIIINYVLFFILPMVVAFHILSMDILVLRKIGIVMVIQMYCLSLILYRCLALLFMMEMLLMVRVIMLD